MVSNAEPLRGPGAVATPRVRLIETRLLDPVETVKLWKSWNELYQVLGLFPTCPMGHDQTQLVAHRVRDGKEERIHLRAFEIQQEVPGEPGAVKLVGWCYAPSWEHLRRYAAAVHRIDLPDTDPDA